MFKSRYWSNIPYKAADLTIGKMDTSFGTAPVGLNYVPGSITGIVKENKSILLEGSDLYAQMANGSPSSSLPDVPPIKFYSIVSCSLGGLHGGYVDDSARLFLWGTNANNQLGDGTTTPQFTPTEIVLSKSGNKLKINKVECGVRHTLALAEDGTLFVTGNNSNGQLGRGNTTAATAFMTIISSSVTDIASGWYNSYIISGGFLCASGRNDFGQVGDGTFTQRTSFTRTTGSATNIIDLAGGAEHCLYVKSDNTLWGFGRNNNNQLFTSTTTFTSSSIHRRLAITSGSNAISASKCSAGYLHSALISTDKRLYTCGVNTYGQVGNGTFSTQVDARWIDSDVEDAACGVVHTLYRKTDGSVWFMGQNAFGQSGLTNTMFNVPKLIATASVVTASACNNNTFYITSNSDLFGMGKGDFGQFGSIFTGSIRANPIFITSSVLDVACGTLHTMYLDTLNKIWVSGNNASGQLGLGNTTNRTTGPFTSSGNFSAKKIAAGGQTSFAITTTDDLYGVGLNTNGQLGIGTTTNTSSWQFITSSVIDVQHYGGNTLFIKSDNTMWGMGGNGNGFLGDGTTTQKTTRTFITGSVKKLARGSNSGHALFIKTDNTLWAQGANNCGQLGTGNNTNYSRSIQIDTNVVDVAVGGGAQNGYTLYVKTDGSLWGMGASFMCNLPNPLSGSYNPTPTKLMESASFSLANALHTMLVKNDGTLWGWGNSEGGQIGDGIATTNLTPIRIYP